MMNQVLDAVEEYNMEYFFEKHIIPDDGTFITGQETHRQIFEPDLYSGSHEEGGLLAVYYNRENSSDSFAAARSEFYKDIGYDNLNNCKDKIAVQNAIYQKFSKYYICDNPRISSTLSRYNPEQWRMDSRKKFRENIKKRGLTLTQLTRIIPESIDEADTICHDAIVFEQISKAVKDREERLHQQRLEVSRIAMRSGLPSDLVPMLCAFAVPASKIHNYM